MIVMDHQMMYDWLQCEYAHRQCQTYYISCNEITQWLGDKAFDFEDLSALVYFNFDFGILIKNMRQKKLNALKKGWMQMESSSSL